MKNKVIPSLSDFKLCCYILLVIEFLLALAHIIFPDYTWGQGRSSYFNMGGTFTMSKSYFLKLVVSAGIVVG